MPIGSRPRPAQVVDPARAEAAGVVDEAGVGPPVGPLARHQRRRPACRRCCGTLSGGKATSPWRGKITLASSPKRATSTPRMRGRVGDVLRPPGARGRGARIRRARSACRARPAGSWPNTLTSTHGLSRPYFSICSRAHSALTRVARLGSSGSAVISVTCHSRRSLVQARHSGPSRWVGLPACTMWPSTHEASAASARRHHRVGNAARSRRG